MTCLMGIDPGLTGSLVALNDRVCSVWRMPLLEGKRQRIDVAQVNRIIRECRPALITLEQAQSRRGQGVTSSFNYGVTYGALLATVTLLDVPHRVVSPQAWKRRYSLAGNAKAQAIEVAIRRVPTLRLVLYDEDGRPLYPKALRVSMCEAALLALAGAGRE
jgi:crossover junction endodeoxyribonuclease RuvC